MEAKRDQTLHTPHIRNREKGGKFPYQINNPLIINMQVSNVLSDAVLL